MLLEGLQCNLGEGMSPPEGASISRLKVKKLWVWVAFLCWVEVHEMPWDYVVPTVLGSQATFLLKTFYVSPLVVFCIISKVHS